MSSSNTPVRRTQEERRADSEAALLDAAARLFARKGVESSSLAEIGAEAGFSRALANHRFGTRAALVERLAKRSQRRVVQRLSLRGNDTPAIMALAGNYLEVIEEDLEGTRAFVVMWGSAFAEEAQLRPVFANNDAWFRDAVAARIRAGQKAGVLDREVDADGFAVTLVAMLRGIAGQVAVAPDAIDLGAARRTVADLIRSYLEPKAQPAEQEVPAR